MASAPTLVSSAPLILMYENFASQSEVAELLELSMAVDAAADTSCTLPQDVKLVSDIEARIGEIVCCEPHDEEWPLLMLRVAKRVCDDEARDFSFHVDANGGMPRRFASALLYLNSPAGGQTVFPLAGSPSTEALEASRKLLDAKVYHTGNTKNVAAGKTLEALAPATPSRRAAPVGAPFAATERGVSIRPIAGNLVVFWTRDPSGDICERSWHGGEPVPRSSSEDKWLLRKFKEIPMSTWHSLEARAEFVADSRSPHLDAEGRAAAAADDRATDEPKSKRRRDSGPKPRHRM